MTTPAIQSPTSPLLSAALAYASRGIPVFPLIRGGKTPVIASNKDNRSAGGQGFMDATTDAAQIREWWRVYHDSNIGIATGDTFTRDLITKGDRLGETRRASGWLVVDIDTKHGATYDDLAALGPLPKTLTAQTATGGLHLVFQYPEGHHISISESRLAHGIDVRARGGYIAAAPSRRPEGVYEWVNDVEVAPCPTWLVKRLVELENKPIERNAPTPIVTQLVTQLATGNRDAHWLAWALAKAFDGNSDRIGYELAQQLLLDPGVRDRDAVLREYASKASFNPQDPFTEVDIKSWVDSAMSSRLVTAGIPARNPTSSSSVPRQRSAHGAPNASNIIVMSTQGRPRRSAGPSAMTNTTSAVDWVDPSAVIGGDSPSNTLIVDDKTDVGNAERFCKRHRADLRFCALWKQWLVWDGKRWQPDDAGRVMQFAVQTAKNIYREAAELEERRDASELAKWAKASSSKSRLEAMITIAQSYLGVTPDELDADPWLFNVENGTLDLRLGTLRPHRREDLITKLAPVTYDPHAECPSFMRFLERVFEGNKSMISYIQRVVGYALTGDTREQCVFIPFGIGSNGKSTFIGVMHDLIGEYARNAKAETFTVKERGNNEDTYTIAELKGARFVSAQETEEGKKLAESRIKELTGGDMVSARHLYGKPFSFRPAFKIFLSTNHKPVINGTDNGIWRRIHLIPFNVSIPDEEKDLDLPRKLRDELPGILMWAVAGCTIWRARGLQKPTEVVDATASYRNDMDLFGDFINEECVTHPQCEVSMKALYARYQTWVEENGHRPVSKKRLSQILAERGFMAIEDSRTHMKSYVGMKLR